LSFPQLQLFCIVLASKTLQTLPKEEEEEEEKHNRVVGLGQILCSLLALLQSFRQLDRERLEKIRAAASSFITWKFVQLIKTVPTQKTQEKKKKNNNNNNKNCKNLTSSSLSLSISTKSKHKNLKTKTPTNSPKQKAITKTSKTHTQLPQNSPLKNQQQKNVCTKFSEHSFASTICHNHSPKFTNPPKSVN
jgi:hypothetical protein